MAPPGKPASKSKDRQKSDSVSSTPTKVNKKNDKNKQTPKAKPIRCKQCNEVCLDEEFMDSIEDESIACDICGHWYHKPCTDVGTDEWTALKGGNESITYKCENCLKTNAQVVTNQANMFQQLLLQNNELIFKRLESLESNIMNKVDKKIDQRMRELEVKNKKEIEDQISAKLDNFRQDKQEQVNIEDQIKVHVTQSFDELKERQERKNNLILFNIKESTNADINEAIKEDVRAIQKVFQHTNPEMSDSLSALDEEKIIRLGKKKEDSASSARPRPVKVILPEEHFKFKILKNTHKLKNFTENPRVGVKLDLTRQQQIEEKELREELERRKKLGEDVMIFRGKVILRGDHAKIRKEAASAFRSGDGAAANPETQA